MQRVEAVYALTGAGVSLATILSMTGPMGQVSKVRLQTLATATGAFKVQNTNVAYSVTTAGTFRQPGTEYFIEDTSGGDAIHLEQYFVCGANPTDLLFIEVHVG